MNGALDDMIAALDTREAGYVDAAPASWWGAQGLGLDLTLPPVPDLPNTGAGMTDLFRNISDLVRVGYQGQALVEQQKFANKIAAARMANQLETVRTTPNLWLVLGIGAAGLFAFSLMDRRR